MAGSAIVAGGFFGVPLGTCEQEVVPQAKQGLLGIFPWGRQGDGKAGPSKPVAAEKASTLRAELEEIKRQLQANLKVSIGLDGADCFADARLAALCAGGGGNGRGKRKIGGNDG